MLLPADPRWGHRRLHGRALRVELANPADPNATEAVELLVDPTLVHSIVPTGILQRLGIHPWSERDFLLTDGSRVRRKMGGVLLKHRGHITTVNVIFGDEGESARIGKLALEALGFSLDPVVRRR
jgi:predicted aspartyl protease